MATKIRRVTGCIDCPYRYRALKESERINFNYCTFADRMIGTQITGIDPENPETKFPKWCPLKKDAQMVKLVKEDEQ